MKSFRKILLGILGAVAIIAIIGSANAQEPKSPARQELHIKISQFAKTEVFPSLREWKTQLDGAMSPADLTELNALRSRAAELRKQAISQVKSMRESWKSEDYTNLKASRDGMKSIKEQRDQLFSELKPIAVKYATTLKSIGEVAKPKVEGWKEKGREIFKTWAESHKGDLKDGKNFPHHGGFWKQFADGDKKKAVARFMLWNGDENILDEQGQLTPQMMNPGSRGAIEPTNAPNPFESNTAINFSLPKSDKVTLKIFDVNGNYIQTIVDEELAAGEHSYAFAPTSSQSASGTYFYRLQTSDGVQQKTMELVR
ncbi:MAG: T9SS type A sorting domain-containing protein [Ignavibacteriae bacterium]|nr:T9SS type A sorting domain-containing protein [Ignavibacteriota bacterium]